MAHHRRGNFRIVIYLSLVVFFVLIVVSTFIILKLRASLPVRDGEIQIEGLGSPVTITRDRLGIPSISAQTRRDAVMALGYVTAQDRLFQMDLLRRRAAGRLSEILGDVTIELIRGKGLSVSTEWDPKSLPTFQMNRRNSLLPTPME